MTKSLLERLRTPEEGYRFGAVAIRADNAALVVVTELPDPQEAKEFPAVNVSEIEYNGNGESLRPAGSLPIDRLSLLSTAPWPVDKVVELVVRSEFGPDAGEELIASFREIYERNAAQPAMAAA